MKTKKGMWALSLLFVLALIGTMFVPVVSAEEVKNSKVINTTILDLNKIELPVLQFDTQQEKKIITNELSLTESNGVSSKGISSIPSGSIIYHSKDGITTVFSSSGKQILAAEDKQSGIIQTPAGIDKPATYICQVPGESHVYSKENVIYVANQKNELILTIINNNVNTNLSNEINSKSVRSLYRGWLEYAEDVVSGGLTQFDAYWHVPSKPPDMDYGKAIFIFNGVEPPDETYGLLQPVLAFYPYENGQEWYGEAWCYAMNPYDPDNDCIVGPRISVNEGDRIKGRILWSSTYNQWYVQFTDLTTGDLSTIWSSLVHRHNNLDVSVVLEGKVVDDNNDMPGDIEFYNMEFKNNGAAVNGVYFEGYVDSNKPSGITGLWPQIISNPSDVKLNTYN
ncbi:hypothetical protein J2128_000300 [Methanomicrobium sp. W14]|uniref:hypothetical protein n=1 Tax=Methanomicrobium sp. W14 TaxID=2817839 RepID=UPI001AE2F6EB|nr:hypothetical protein [Methanomicrobium sp. W14]MBP2132379.1 hypothetical protein [Methanomicrobium sp. W14]